MTATINVRSGERVRNRRQTHAGQVRGYENIIPYPRITTCWRAAGVCCKSLENLEFDGTAGLVTAGYSIFRS